MPTLYLMRHAQAAHGGNDYLRPLTDKGRTQAWERGQQLPDMDLALVSGATRAQQTADGVERAAAFSERENIDDLYNASWTMIHDLLAGRSADSIIVIGHEPIISMTATRFAFSDPRVHEVRGGVSPSTVIALEVPSWDFTPGSASITEIYRG